MNLISHLAKIKTLRCKKVIANTEIKSLKKKSRLKFFKTGNKQTLNARLALWHFFL